MAVPSECPNAVEGPGELRARGHNIFKEYINKPEATAEAFDEDGWFRCALLIGPSISICKTFQTLKILSTERITQGMHTKPLRCRLSMLFDCAIC
jgi:acyl-CoA synthetase (AMP-forming)/AMP-acid ligase II